MKTMRWITLAALSAACLMMSPRASAQAPSKPDKIIKVKNLFGLDKNSRLRTPAYTVNGGGRIVRSTPGNVREWVQLVAEYYTVPDARQRWLNQVTFQFYVLTAQENRETKALEYNLFRGTVNYRDVDRNRGDAKWATLYLAPTATARYGEPIAVAVEVSADGNPMESVAEVERRFQERLKNEKEWWKNPKLPVKDGYLLKATDTPFGYIGYDDYEEIAH